ncbi:Sbal_3080 family lipoprotein [Marinimicrobium sp. ABcell2]|uniref:Sbal_3080 family lipoprotein n=1 Tax=Marinimicrobium sp. ABcell2 TaxID=3069751 RepID=UPI0027AF3E1E|nr:Sbal_3080 family lipoprotein [Marinimicrobium sp. ABcell2]MDQ2077821.1 Sbal_3080 family lipoprotein [Marinimicrobium sp. ABcell2]
MKKIIALGAIVIFMTACSIKQTLEPAQLASDADVCVVNNPKVRDGVLSAMSDVLAEKGVAYRIVESDESAASCDWRIKYTANWHWDLAVYMTYVRIDVYYKESLEGFAEYDSRRGGGRLDKFIDADAKIRELVEELIQREYAFLLNRSYG